MQAKIIGAALANFLLLLTAAGDSRAETILFESGTLGETGLARENVTAANVSADVFNGVRFHLSEPVLTSQIGGHFVGSPDTMDAFFGAIVQLDGSDDFPDSGDLSTPDVLGSTVLQFPAPSAEVFGPLELALEPGWYALVFGSGLFGASGDGAMPLNNSDIGHPTYIGFQPGTGWFNLTDLSDAFEFVDYRIVALGHAVPEPSTSWLLLLIIFLVVATYSVAVVRRSFAN